MSEPSPYRLPLTVIPHHYDLVVEPDLDAAAFTGEVRVDVRVGETTDEILLNAAELEIADAYLSDTEGRRIDLTVELLPDTERARLRSESAISSGTWALNIRFSGTINDHLRGFYRSVYIDDEGERRVIGVTQFEATDARRAFPCWDEPELKATFRITLVIDPDLFAVANTSIVEDTLRDGKRHVRFRDTIRMSTYLVAWVVGPLVATDPVDVDGIPLRIVHTPGNESLTRYSLEVGSFALRYLAKYYDIPYPGDKLDLIALSDFAWGAMENLGAVTFRDNLLLVDPAQAGQAERMRIDDVIAHEIAHMWFGDLVTMKWWNGIWLNEAFATFMELKTTHAGRPEWDRWTLFGVEAARAKEIDALGSTRPIDFEVESPDDANEMFDALTYQKGASILRMLEQHIGEDAFRRGVAAYLRAHAHGNAETHHLWEALTEAGGQDVRAIMNSWVQQGGLPLVTVRSTDAGVELDQQRFVLLRENADERRWRIPLAVRHLATGRVERVLLDDPVAIAVEGPVLANAGGHGFFVVDHGEALPAVLEHYAELAPLERFLLVDDAWALVLGGYRGLEAFLQLLPVVASERDPAVWQVVAGALGEIDRIVPDAYRERFRSLVVDLTEPGYRRLGWDSAGNEPDLDRRLRGLLIELRGRFGADPETVDRCHEIVEHVLSSDAGSDPDVVQAAVRVTAWHGSIAEYGRFAARYEDPASPQDRVRFLTALPLFPEPEMAGRTFEMVLDGRIRNQDGPAVLAALLRNRRVGRGAWRMLTSSWDEVAKVLPERTSRRVLMGLPALSEPALVQEVIDWFATHPTSHPKTEAQNLELLRVFAAFRRREAGRLGELLEG